MARASAESKGRRSHRWRWQPFQLAVNPEKLLEREFHKWKLKKKKKREPKATKPSKARQKQHMVYFPSCGVNSDKCRAPVCMPRARTEFWSFPGPEQSKAHQQGPHGAHWRGQRRNTKQETERQRPSRRTGADSPCVSLCFPTSKKDRRKFIIPLLYWEHVGEKLWERLVLTLARDVHLCRSLSSLKRCCRRARWREQASIYTREFKRGMGTLEIAQHNQKIPETLD